MSQNIVTYSSPLKILYVDDDPEDKEFFSEALDKLSLRYELFLAGDYDEMIRFLNENPHPDIIFLDLNLPGNDGIHCLKELKDNKNWKQIPVIIFSTNRNTAIIQQVYDLGAHYYVAKPYAQINFVVSLSLIFSVNWHLQQNIPARQFFTIDNTFTVDDNLQSGKQNSDMNRHY